MQFLARYATDAEIFDYTAKFKLLEESADGRRVSTEAFSDTFPSFYVENGLLNVTGSGTEQSIGIF